MGGPKPVASTPQKLATIQVQTSAYGVVIPIVYGTARVAGNLIWYDDFIPIKHTEQIQGGKGGNNQTTTNYTYKAALILGICEGPIVGVSKVWRDKEVNALTRFFQTLQVGSRTQSPWSYLTTAHAAKAIGYAGTAHACTSAADLGSSGSLKNHAFEVQAPFIVGGGNLDANPADIVPDILSNAFYGAGWPAGKIGDLSTGAASYRTYCTALGLWLSPALTEQKPAREHLNEILEATNSAAVWSAGVLKIIPYGDVAVTANGTTFTPVTAPVYDLGVDDFLAAANEDPITVERASPADTYNSYPIEFADRAQDYNTSVIEDVESVDVELSGLRKAAVTSLRCIKLASAALQISRIKAQRSVYVRNTYTFRLPWRHIRIEPMDLVTITEPKFGLDHKVVRVVSIEEDEKYVLTVKAKEWPFGVATATQYTPQAGSGTTPNADEDPGNANTPVIFEISPLYTDGVPTMCIATAGGAQWGGANVWISYDGTTYSMIGSITQKARYGTNTTTLLANLAGPDNPSGTVRVDLGVSGGTLVSASAQDKDDVVTACWIRAQTPASQIHEIFSFQGAALVSGNTYDLTAFRRGCYGTSRTQKTSGKDFVRLDEAVFKYPIPPARIGTQVWVKLQSFNRYGGGAQDVASLSAYTYTPTSFQLTSVAPGTCTLSVATTAPTIAAGQRRHKTWDEGFVYGDNGGDQILKRNAWATVTWTFLTLWPTSLLSRFRIVLYTGSDPNDESGYLIAPLDVASGVLVAVIPIPTMGATTAFNAAVQAMFFGDRYESAWRTTAATQNLVPNTLLLGEPLTRALAIRRNTVTLDRSWYGGNVDTAARGGAPDIARLTVTRRAWLTGGAAHGRLELKLLPNSGTDNIDSMRYARIDWFRQSAAGTTATLTAVDTTYVPLPDRKYETPTSDGNATNAVYVHAMITDAAINAGFPACKVTLHNAFGPSDTHCFYADTGNADGSALVDNGTSWPGGITGDGGGGTGGGSGPGGYCVASWTPVRTEVRGEVPAGSLRVGDILLTIPEDGDEVGRYPVSAIARAAENCLCIVLHDGRALVCSIPHRLRRLTGHAGGEWVTAADLRPGDVLDGAPGGMVVDTLNAGQVGVIRLTVDDAHTYLSNGILSHNAKNLGGT